jgi:hypothetical protein
MILRISWASVERTFFSILCGTPHNALKNGSKRGVMNVERPRRTYSPDLSAHSAACARLDDHIPPRKAMDQADESRLALRKILPLQQNAQQRKHLRYGFQDRAATCGRDRPQSLPAACGEFYQTELDAQSRAVNLSRSVNPRRVACFSKNPPKSLLHNVLNNLHEFGTVNAESMSPVVCPDWAKPQKAWR